MTIGADSLLRKYGSPLLVAEALLLNQINGYEQQFVGEIVGKSILEAAKFRVEKLGGDALVESLRDDGTLNPKRPKKSAA